MGLFRIASPPLLCRRDIVSPHCLLPFQTITRRLRNPWAHPAVYLGYESPSPLAPGRHHGSPTCRSSLSQRDRVPAFLVVHGGSIQSSFASYAVAVAEALPAIDKLLGLSNIETTACYAHLAQNPVHETVKQNAESIAAEIL